MTEPGSGRSSKSLAVRLLFLLSLALLPIGSIAIFQTVWVVNDSNELARRDILSQTSEAANKELDLIRHAAGVARTIGIAAVDFGDDVESCSRLATRIVENDSRFAFAGFIQSNGMMQCGNNGVPFDFNTLDAWAPLAADPRPVLGINREGVASGKSVVIVNEPIWSDDGEFLGIASVSLPHSLLDVTFETEEEAAIVGVALIDSNGRILASSSGLDDPVFESMADEIATKTIPPQGKVLSLQAGDVSETVAAVPLQPYGVTVVGRWLPEGDRRAGVTFTATAVLLPVLMWATSLFVAFYAMQNLVLRHLRKLQQKMALFSVDDMAGGYLDLSGAPKEFVDISKGYNALLDRIALDTAVLAKNVEEKETLLKELHHRVKNNLQLIASILNMQLRQIEEPETRNVLQRLQERVLSLAAIHKLLYTDTDVETVRADLLLREIIESVIKAGADGEAINTDISLAPVALDPDQAVPLALLATEAATNALKYLGATGQDPATLSVSFDQDADGRVTLDMANSLGTGALSAVDDTSGLGTRLIEAFVSQLGGEFEVDATAEMYRSHISFRKLEARQLRSEAA